jgi:membrane protein implicated in regulation of membrane protease activity
MAGNWQWAWLIAGALLAIAEMATPGFFLIWIGAASFLTGLVTLLLPLPLAGQLAFFAAVAVASVFGSIRLARSEPIVSDDPLLNERTARLVGRTVTVVEPIANGEGRVRVGDGEWSALGDDAAAGDYVRIVGARGGRLEVEKI